MTARPQNYARAYKDDQLELLVRLVAAILVDGKSKNQAIARLAEVGIPTKQIAEILHVSANRVSVTLYQARRKGTEADEPSADR